MDKFADSLTARERKIFVILLLLAMVIDFIFLMRSIVLKFIAESNYSGDSSDRSLYDVIMLSNESLMEIFLLVIMSAILYLWADYWRERSEAAVARHKREMDWRDRQEETGRPIFIQNASQGKRPRCSRALPDEQIEVVELFA